MDKEIKEILNTLCDKIEDNEDDDDLQYATQLEAEEKISNFIKETYGQIWIDTPDKAGMYWMSAFCDGRYIDPSIKRVIDYCRPGKGLEVDYDRFDTIPIKTFVEEYYPKAKWLFIPQPDIKNI